MEIPSFDKYKPTPANKMLLNQIGDVLPRADVPGRGLSATAKMCSCSHITGKDRLTTFLAPHHTFEITLEG